MSAIEELAKLLEESGATMVFRHQDVHAAFIDLNAELTRTKRALEIAVSTLEGFSGIYENQQMSTTQVASTMLKHSIGALVDIRKELGE